MSIFLLILSIVLIITGSICWFRRHQLNQQVLDIKETETSKIQELQEMAQGINEELGESGVFSQQVEVKGRTRSEDPLTANVSGKPCVYCHTIITEKYEEEVEIENDEGEIEIESQEQEEEVTNSVNYTPFWVEDETGQIVVSPDENTQIEGIQVLDHFESDEDDEMEIEIGNLEIELPMQSDETLGYHYQETILPLDTQVYVLGEASNSDGQLEIRQPSDEGNSFIITHKSEEKLLKDKRDRIKNYTIASTLTFFFGLGLLLALVINQLTN